MSAQTLYEPSLTMRDARTRYFEANKFGKDGGYNASWVILKAGGIPFFAIPNTKGRKRAVRYHDLHHMLTGYSTTMGGECEIAAWELGSHCRDLWAAWVLNLGGLGLGVLYAPAKMKRAFVRGRHTHNLYDREFTDELLGRQLGELRTELGLDEPEPEPTAEDTHAFRAYAAAGLAVVLAQIVLFFAPLIALWWLLA